MADFTNEWDITIPAGTEDISQGDDRIRAFKADIEERLEAFFYGFNHDSTSGDEATAGVKALNFKEQSSISTPSADQITIAAKEAGGKAELHVKDEDGDEFQITTGGKIGGSNVELTAGKNLTGSSTSNININDKFTVAGATGNTSVGGTFESVGVATLADASVTKTTAAPGADAQIANKKYIDDSVKVFSQSGYSSNQAIGTDHTAATDIIVTAFHNGETDGATMVGKVSTTAGGSPTLTVQDYEHNTGFGIGTPNFTFPVPKDFKWRVNSSRSATVKFLAIS